MNFRLLSSESCRALSSVTGHLVAAALVCPSAPTQDVPIFNLVEDLRIVSNDASPQTSLTQLAGLTVLSDGSIVTAHTSEALVRVFSASGKFMHSFGRRGEGPGEFSQIWRLGTVGDSIWVDDLRNRRFNLFTRSGQFVRTVAYPPTDQASGRGSGLSSVLRNPLGLLPGRRVLIREEYRRPLPLGAADFEEDSSVYVVHDSLGNRTTRIVAMRTGGHPSMRFADRAGLSVTQPLAPRVEPSIAPGAQRFVVASDAALWGGQPGELRLSELSANGSVAHTTVALPAIRLPANYRDSLTNRIMTSVQRGYARSVSPAAAANEFEKELREKLFLPQFFQVNSGNNLLGADGSLWLKYYFPDKSWAVIAGGRLVMRVRVPDDIRLYQVSRDGVWGVKTDPDGLPIILRYTVARG